MKLSCHECGDSCTNDVLPDNFVIRAWIVCGDCQAKIPQAAFDAVFAATSRNGKRYIDTPDDELQPRRDIKEFFETDGGLFNSLCSEEE